MVIQHREPTHRDREDFSKFLEPILDPSLAVVRSFPEQETPAAHTALRSDTTGLPKDRQDGLAQSSWPNLLV